MWGDSRCESQRCEVKISVWGGEWCERDDRCEGGGGSDKYIM